tara:strand:+ start:3530 stop:4504 length:975 start_codon:yes stop_codon:yes gene_type:complete
MDLLTAFKQYGSTPLSYSTLQPDATYFWGNTDTPSGYIAYFCHSFLGKQYISVLGDPIADSRQWPSLLSAFLQRYPLSSFYNISNTCYSLLTKLGLWGRYMGWDVYRDPSTPIASKRAINHLRRLQNKWGISIRERDLSIADRPWITQITDQWVKTRLIRHEIRSFFCRPLYLDHPHGLDLSSLCRYVVAFDATNRPIGFMVLDPLYRQGHCLGYVVNHVRYLPQYPFLPQLFRYFSRQDIIALGPVTCPNASLFFRHNWGFPFKSIRDARCRYSHHASPLYFASTSRLFWIPWMALYGSVFYQKNKKIKLKISFTTKYKYIKK